MLLRSPIRGLAGHGAVHGGRELASTGRLDGQHLNFRRATVQCPRRTWRNDRPTVACVDGTVQDEPMPGVQFLRASTVRLHSDDDVVIAVRDLSPGTQLEAEGVTVTQRIPAGHKVATRAAGVGAAVRRYAQIIGFATSPIAEGDHVHTHNLEMGARRARPRVRQGLRPDGPGQQSRDVHGHSPCRRKRRDPELPRRHLDGELLGHRFEGDRRSLARSARPRELPQHRRRRRAHPRQRVRPGFRGSGTRSPPTHHRGVRDPPEHRRSAARRPRVRVQRTRRVDHRQAPPGGTTARCAEHPGRRGHTALRQRRHRSDRIDVVLGRRSGTRTRGG